MTLSGRGFLFGRRRRRRKRRTLWSLVRSFSTLSRSRRRHNRRRRKLYPGATTELTLANVPIGCWMRVLGFLPGLSAERRAHLQAYGLVPGYWVMVLQHSPVTVVLVDHTELALEWDLARQVRVIDH